MSIMVTGIDQAYDVAVINNIYMQYTYLWLQSFGSTETVFALHSTELMLLMCAFTSAQVLEMSSHSLDKCTKLNGPCV